MESKSKVAGHAIHPMLIVFPLGLFATSILFDVLGMLTGIGAWFYAVFWMIACGVVGGLVAAVFGLVDWLAVPNGSRAKRVGAWHGGGNVVVVLLFIISWFLRLPNASAENVGAFVLGCIGVALALITGWLGGELVEQLAVGINDGANANAPSSIEQPQRPSRTVPGRGPVEA